MVTGDREVLQPVEPPLELCPREGHRRDRDDRVVLVGFASLGRPDHLLTQVLTWEHARDLDRDVGSGLVSAETDHPLGELVDVDLLAHVERVHLSPGRDRSDTEHEPDGLVGAHEVARHRCVRDGDRSAGVDLTLERGNHAPAAPEDVAEAHRAVRGILRRACEHDLFRDPFRRGHHTARRGRLVGGDAHQVGCAGAYTGVDDVRRPGDVRLDGFACVLFEDRHVLVRSRVEHQLWSHPGEQRVDGRRVANVAQCELSGRVDFLQRVVQVGLVVIEEHQSRGGELGNLPGDLRTDPSPAASDEHALAGEQLSHRREVDRYLVATEEVFDLEVAQVAQVRHPVYP